MEPPTIKAHGMLPHFPKRPIQELDVAVELKVNDGAPTNRDIAPTTLSACRRKAFMAAIPCANTVMNGK